MNRATFLACALALGAPLVFAQEAKRAPVLPLTEDPVVGLEKLPKGESIMDRAMDAAGGIDAFKKIKSMVSKGTFESMGMSASLTVYMALPNLTLMEIELPFGMGKVLDGCDGTNAWSYSASMGPSVKSGRAAEDALEAAKFDDRDWRDRYTKAETKGVELAEGEECYKVELTRKKGGSHVQYFSRQTGLLVRADAEVETEMGKQSSATAFMDYRKVGDVLIPFKTVITAAGQTITTAFTEVKFNVDIPKGTFDPPKEVMDLLKK